ncbi:MAG: DEAD/DEAH box helicase, partial [Acidimicrobiales bacterium]
GCRGAAAGGGDAESGWGAVSAYADFLAGKRAVAGGAPVPCDGLSGVLFGFQSSLVRWALQKGRAAIFSDCGTGKTVMELAWAREVGRFTGRRVLVLTPLAVSYQTAAEADKFGFDAARAGADGSLPDAQIVVTNYERLHLLNIADFGAIICDESSCLKAFDGARRGAITAAMRRVPYRLLASATPAPNDYTELGTSSEALGYLGAVDMLNKFFVNDRNNSAQGRAFGKALEWRFRGHAEEPFWRWVVSWARAMRRPSDIGFPDDGFVLPPLSERQHVVKTSTPPPGWIFPVEAVTLQEQREERRRTLQERCERVAALVDDRQAALVWCHLNDEGDLLERLIPGAVQVSGADSDEAKEERLLAFARGQIRTLVTKPVIGGWGLNFQNCAHETFFPSHSFEQYYQALRRCWRFGQTRPVTIDIVTTEGELRVLSNLQAKARAAEAMFARLVQLMNGALSVGSPERLTEREVLPSWL